MASTVLIVDDDEMAVGLMMEALETEGYEILSSTSGQEAMALLKREKVDLLVTDLYMPGMRGQELIVRARTDSPNLAALVITGSSEHINTYEWTELQDCPLLYKPFTTNELRAAVADALRIG